MPHPRAWRSPLALVVASAAMTAAACAPGPSFTSDAGPIITTTTRAQPATPTIPPTTTTQSEDRVPQIAPLDIFPVTPEELGDLDRVNGRVAFTGANAAIRSGGSTIELETGALPSQPTWSRDGQRLAVVSLNGRETTIDVFDGLTGETIASTPAERFYFFLSWSHDGSRIAALGPGVDDNGDGRTVLDILDADGALLQAGVAEAESLFVAWDPDGLRLAAHADDRLLRIDADGTATDLGGVGIEFFAPKWIPFTNEILLTTDIEGSPFLVRRSIDGSDTLRTLGEVGPQTGIAVNPDGTVAALSREFEVEGGGGGEKIATPMLPQTASPRSGAVDILDLETGERVTVFTGFNLWTEWNPQGTRLLIYESDLVEGTGTWWVYEHEPTIPEPTPPTEVLTFSPTPIFFSSYIAFSDQFIESPRLWSPTGTDFVFAELTDRGSLIRTANASGNREPATLGAGEVGFWSPSG